MLKWQCGIMTLFTVFREITGLYQASLILDAAGMCPGGAALSLKKEEVVFLSVSTA